MIDPSPALERAPLVIGLDASTTATKAIAWTREGRPVAEGRAPVDLLNPGLGLFEQNSADWWHSATVALSALCAQIDVARLEGLAISNQRETLAFLDGAGNDVRPAITWLDERSRPQVATFPAAFGKEAIHRITGRHPDLTPCLYRLAWMRENEPEATARVACFADVQTFLVNRLTGGGFRTGWISADPMGLFDMVEKRWSEPLLEALGLAADRFPEAYPPGTRLGRVAAAAAHATGLPEGLPIFAAGGDGQLAGLGTNCTSPERAYINLGTAVVAGVWSRAYRYDVAWRTELAGQGEGYILETCLRSGTFLVNWFVDQFVARNGRADAAVFQALEAAATEVPIGCDGLLVQPYWSGVMDPHWDADARGVMVGLCGSHKPAHLYRAIIEGITIDQALRTTSLEAARGAPVEHFVAIGGGAASPLWRQMLADATGKPVLISETVEASSLGAAMIAATGAGWYGSIVEAARAMAGETRRIAPDAAAAARYGELIAIYRDVYAATRTLNSRLTAFAAGGSA